ncbi:DUF5126 domain-containing protein [Dysgonomonas termitidis]|uniref:DUF5126 domain-containing protein n=1 Tax=Dysgonomonas termitidis TaxID=1516126 RepID=A0ABV9KWR5_9BACT
MKIRSILIAIFATLFLWNCDNVKDWSDPTDSIPPGIVTNINVTNIHGGAIITYSLPSDDDLLAVKAVYTYSENGNKREIFSSANNNIIKLEGYPDTGEYTVFLYVLDKSKNESSPVEVKIKPLLPPVEQIKQSLNINPTFGGIYTLWENLQQDEISLTMYTKDDDGEYQFYDAYYSKTLVGKTTFRGLTDKPQEFRFQIRDKWGNLSQPLDTILTPLFEEEIVGRNQSGYIWQRWGYTDKTCLYRGDLAGNNTTAKRGFEQVHDGDTWNNSEWWHSNDNKLNDFVDWPEPNAYILPYYFTIDMTKKASYSRLRYWMRSRSPIFSANTFISLEVWATNSPKPLDQIGDGSKEQNLMYWTDWKELGGTGEWRNDWMKLADYDLVLPSGGTDPNFLTNEDHEFIKVGFEVELDPQYANTPFRYIRFVIRKNREANYHTQLSELKFWGSYQD